MYELTLENMEIDAFRAFRGMLALYFAELQKMEPHLFDFYSRKPSVWAYLLNPSIKCSYICINSKVIGFICYQIHHNNGENGLYVNELFILPEYRRRGFGKKALAFVLTFNQRVSSYITCLVIQKNIGAKHFLLNALHGLGFDTETDIFLDSLSPWRVFLFKKIIANKYVSA